MAKKLRHKIEGKELKIFASYSIILLFLSAFMAGGLDEILTGMRTIVVSRDALITDYFELAGYAPAFFNAACVLAIGYFLLCVEKISFTGITAAALFINAGYAFWGKNPINILPILLGTFLYARLHKTGFGRYIYTALFGTCLAPLVTEMVYLLPFSDRINLLLAVLLGIFIGFVLPPLSMHTASMHMGYNLFNVGFSAGVLAFVIVCILKSLDMESSTVLIWREGRPLPIILVLYAFFLSAIGFGLFVNKGSLKELKNIMRHPGRAVADYVLMDGVGATLMNMGMVGSVCVTYIIVIKGDFSGPVVGAILTAFGFAAFGAHLKNFLPVLAGVFLSTLLTRFEPATPGIQLAAAFAVGLAPIAGQFGVIAGMIAGILHSAIVMCTSEMYGGMNLYNNGFSAGWVAIVMIPVVESFMKRFEYRKRRR